jgi:hypothetical protein
MSERAIRNQFTAANEMSLLVCLIVGLAIGVILWRWPALRGTTLVGPAAWLLIALLATGTFEFVRFRREASPELNALRLILASVTLCPAISLVGAKRPQDKAWHFIVASLWMVMMLPGIQALILDRSNQPETHPARSWFLAGLLLFSIANSIFSRYWLCVLLAGFGAMILLTPFLPTVIHTLSNLDPAWGGLSYSIAAIVAVILTYRSRRKTNPFDALWKDFRDGFGLLWTLRVAERINATARSNGWNLYADWRGIHTDQAANAELSPDQSRLFRQNLSNLLRRFVNEDWIAKRLDDK